jgi:hypothetical protein
MKSNRLLIGERLLLTLWVGGLWTVGFIVAPMLFNSLDDRALAGTLAGNLFQIMSYIGLVCGVLLLLGNQFRYRRVNWRTYVLLLMLLMAILNEFLVSPFIASLRQSDAVTSSTFAMAHGTASVIFLITSLLGLFLVAASGSDAPGISD